MAKNDPTIINIDSTETAVKMFDKFSRIKGGRRVQPLDYTDNIGYLHRSYYDGYNLQIGDTCFMIPPEFIMVNAESTSQSIVMLRQENTQKQKSGYHRRTILIDLVFNGIEQLNGYPVNGPEGVYYIDGLRQLLAQFKCAPFLPIMNELINGTYAIFNVALQSITMSTLNGFPGTMTAQLTLQEVCLTPYIEMPDLTFKYMIDWDLFRFYYQRFLTNKHEYKKLQALPYNREFNHFKISILDSSVFESNLATKEKFLDIITDKTVVRVDENCGPCNTNYVTYIDSSVDDVGIDAFQCGYSNILTNIQLSDMGSPTLQFLGGMDTIYNITFDTKDYSVVQALEKCQIENDILTRRNIKLRSVGFVKLESELVEFTGSLFVAIESVTTNTVPGFPGLYSVQMNCVSYDIGQSEREQLNGFRPFDGAGSADHAIDQSWDGLKEKVRQDNYAEWKIRTEIEVYPDLHLPTYSEVNNFIGKCKSFRSTNSLSDLPYTEYPNCPTGALHGTRTTEDVLAEDLFYSSQTPTTYREYDMYVDPDFYVFYPSSYESFLQEDPNYYGSEPESRDSVTKAYGTGTSNTSASDLAEQFIQALKSQLYTPYEVNGDGTVKGLGSKGGFDDTGLITWGLKAIGIMNSSDSKLTLDSIPKSNLFKKIDYEDRQKGDIIINEKGNHAAVCEGNGQIIHSSAQTIPGMEMASGIASAGTPGGMIHYNGVQEGNEFKGTVYRSNFKVTEEFEKTNDTYSLTNAEFESICRYIQNEVMQGGNMPADTAIYRGAEIYKALAQYIFDSITGTELGLGAVLSGRAFPKGPSQMAPLPLVEKCVKDVFVNKKKSYDNKIKLFTRESDEGYNGYSVAHRTKLGSIEGYTFYADNGKSLEASYTIYDSSGNISEASTTGGKGTGKVSYESVTLDSNNVNNFAEPVLARVAKMKYGIYDKDGSGVTWENFLGTNHRTFSRDDLNSGINIFNTSFCDMYQYSARGRLLRAFPAYLFCILDDENQWYDGRKLWTNYYTHRSAVDIAVHETNDMPTATATITISNSYHNLDVTQGGLSKYKITADEEYFGKSGTILNELKKDWYNWSGMTPSFSGPKITSKLIELHSQIYEHAKLREGARIHLRMGYGADPFALAPMINGHISDLSLGDQITMVVTSDGHELIQHITSNGEKHKKDTNNGFLGLFGLGEDQEASDIIAKIMTKRQSWLNKLSDAWFEGSKYGIEHYGLYFQNEAWNVDIPVIGGIVNAAGNIGASINNLWAGQKEQYDILKNIYLANYEREHYVTGQWLFDKERNVVFNKYNMTPWDVFQVCTQQAPEYILKSNMHQFDSRLYFGIPTWMEKYRYNLFGESPEEDPPKKESEPVTITGDSKDGSGKFNENANDYDSGVQPSNPPGIIKGFSLNVQMDEHHTNNRNTDSIDVILYSTDGTATPVNLFTGNLKGTKHSYYFDPAMYAPNVQSVEIKVHTPEDHKDCCPQATINWQFEYISGSYNGSGEYVPLKSGNGLYDECKASTQVHFVDSIANIIDNQVKVTSKFTNTNIKVMYVRGSTTMPTKMLCSDRSIDNAFQKTTIMDSPIVQDALGIDAVGEWLGIYKVGYESAKRIGVSNLLYGWQQQYQGQLLLLGEPGINAHDYLLINDGFANMYGTCIVREVIHSFNTNTGFTTSVVPGMIAFSTSQESGLIVSCQNMLMILKMFSAFINARRELIKNYEHYINIFADFEVVSNKFSEMYNRQKVLGIHQSIGNAIGKIGVAGATYKLIRTVKNAGGFLKFATSTANAFRLGYAGEKLTLGAGGFRAAYAALQVGLKEAAGTAGVFTAGVGTIVILAISFVLDKIIGDVFEWLENGNLVCVLPLWWEDYPFVCRTKDGKYINLIESNATATEEDDDKRADQIDWDGYDYEDE